MNPLPSPPQHRPLDVSSRDLRRELRKDFAAFYGIYLLKESFRPMAPFHAEIFSVLADPNKPLIEVMGFRGSAKSTIGSLAFPLWAALEHPELYQFIVLISDTARQAALNIAAIKYELENNALLKADYGDMRPPEDRPEDWQAKNMALRNGVRIMAFSRGQKVRGIRHREHRPKLIIVDDPEDLEWVRTQENRDKTERWFTGEVIPAADITQRKIVLLGNMLHNDALVARIRNNPLFETHEYPVEGDDGQPLWPAIYPSRADLDKQHATVGEIAWQREYMLKVVAEEDQIIKPEDIHYYDELPQGLMGIIGHGIDLAISKKASADFTAGVNGETHYNDNGEANVYVLPDVLCEHLDFRETLNRLDAMRATGGAHSYFVEAVNYQLAAIEEMGRRGLSVVAMRPIADKRARLQVAAPFIKNGKFLFPRHGCEALLAQLFGFGIEKHDDMVDALVYLILGMMQEGIEQRVVHWI